jgi:predicted CXXCH cytochrome family protein
LLKSHLKEGKNMKKVALITAALVVTSAVSASAAVMSIKQSRHDMTRWNGESGSTQEVCIFCHTPHNALISVPLWNRNNPSAADWKLYNTSATVTSATKASNISHDSISLFCMSCHDGITALGDLKNKNPLVNSYTNNPGDTVPFAVSNTGAKVGGGNVNQYAVIGAGKETNAKGWITANKSATAAGSTGYDLSNTHPIGFDFDAARAEDTGLHTWDDIMTTFKADTTKSTAQPFTYNRAGSSARWFECASCHRVHDPGPSGNFLRIENNGSALCLACHNK